MPPSKRAMRICKYDFVHQAVSQDFHGIFGIQRT
jgi:hypothetical protein